ncbi:MAG: Gfo/Idh/MocA family oxidoreductase [Planctomycetes bacterium]|nr:Gfo/Idh/MocA family oxidoreductase [Planctomycetota bacterium]
MSVAPSTNTTEPAPLRVGLVAPAEDAPALLEAIERSGSLHLAAQVGVAQQQAAAGATWFDDVRSLLASGGIEAVVLGGSCRGAIQVARAAIERGIHVWRIPPLARSFAETTDLLHAAGEHEVVLMTASWWEHCRETVRALLRADEGTRASFSEIRISAVGPPLQSWRASQVDAGGGVLALDAGAYLECLVALRGVPESVTATTGRCRPRATPTPRETEDFAAAILRFSDGDGAVIAAMWDVPPYDAHGLFHGGALTLRIDRRRAATTNTAGALIEERELPGDLLPRELSQFAAAVRGGEALNISARHERQVAVASILETAYLSARTGQPEVPRQLYEAQKWTEPKR